MSDQVIGVVGLGVVGTTLRAALQNAGFIVVGHDPFKGEIGDLSGCSVIFICVSTPAYEDGLDGSAVFSAVAEMAGKLAPGTLVVIKSTVMPGTNDLLSEAFSSLEFASVPEFLTEEDPLGTFTHPDRLVVGARSWDTARKLEGILKQACTISRVFHVLPLEAELVKLCSNALLAAKVTLANEMSAICKAYGMVWNGSLQSAVGADNRIGRAHLEVTPQGGFGGACLPKDLRGLIAAGKRRRVKTRVLGAIEAANQVFRRAEGGMKSG